MVSLIVRKTNARIPCLKWLGVLAIGAALSGCSTMRPPLNQPQSQPQSQPTSSEPRMTEYRLQSLAPQHGNSDNLLVILTFSGGGTRAAAFAYGVLNALKSTPLQRHGATTNLFDEIDVVAGVSGGSITAAYLAAFGDGIFRDFEPTFLKADFQGALLSRTRSPGNALQLSSPWFGRGHLLAEQLDETLFRGTTYGDLAARRTRPFLLVTATDLTQGTGFEFSQDQFDILCSRLDKVPLAVAVAASSAVPLVLSPLTVRNYAGNCAPSTSPRVAATAGAYLDAEKRPFIHLVDGGLSDNLAVRWIIDNIARSGGLAKPIEHNGFRNVDKLVIINVNAAQGPNISLDRSDRIPSIAEVIDAVSSANLARRSRETQEILVSSTAQWREKLRSAARTGSLALSTSIDLYVIDVSLQTHPNPRLREELQAIPTTFSLPPGEVDKLISAGQTILRGSTEFGRLLRELPVNSTEQ
ncbi:MAG: patatin-like phospholipase family protein [Rhodocyclaceae bacterium]|nr:patatin-like phospholipase family protein [Rhodocyclaceae bacterium]